MADTIEKGTTEGAETAREDAEGVVSARDRFQRLSSEVQNRYERVSEDVRRGAERASQEIRRGTERARERYGEVAETARERYTQVREKSGELSRDLTFYVRDNPGRSVMIAAGVGFLVGLLVRRRRGEDDI
jgi:ElaB/YqjD/DUF883 family membrane-anchored ribosome-binding protein